MKNSVPTITVVGSYVTDLMCRTPKMPVPGETVFAGPFKMGPGGKGANQAVAAKRAGADVTMITKLGRDALGEYAFKSIAAEGIKTDYIYFDEKLGTGAALIIVDASGQNMIAVSTEACETLSAQEVRDAKARIQNSDVLLTQYEGSLEGMTAAIDIAKSSGIKIILNPAPARQIDLALLKNVNIITPNESEAEALTGIKVGDPRSAVDAAKKIHTMGPEIVIITMGKAGALVYADQSITMIPSIEVETVDTTGAGDAFSGGLATAIAEGKDVIQAVKFAVCTAALSVTKVGTAPSMPFRNEIEALLDNK
ncbi:MAG: ribokinase [Bacillota bacterium]